VTLEIHGVVQQSEHFDYVVRATLCNTKYDEVATFASITRDVKDTCRLFVASSKR
jgi:hypothetical protein